MLLRVAQRETNRARNAVQEPLLNGDVSQEISEPPAPNLRKQLITHIEPSPTGINQSTIMTPAL